MAHICNFIKCSVHFFRGPCLTQHVKSLGQVKDFSDEFPTQYHHETIFIFEVIIDPPLQQQLRSNKHSKTETVRYVHKLQE